ncbi:MAG: ATP-dependent DNA ligase [Betaproteobacteria bacterium]|nr:ATP-dependent DNA ligase [Betaproteobacteria bacterium]
MTLLTELARASARVAENPGRLAKIAALADFLRRLAPQEIDIAIPYLSGELPQGKLALGYATLASVRGSASPSPSLSLADVHACFEKLKNTKGKGSAAARQQLLKDLFQKATKEEQDFLMRLIVGELRQGALEGVMLEAVAAASGVPAGELRRAATFAGSLPVPARAALTEGAQGLQRFSVRLMQPVMPMLAQPAADAESALAALGTALLDWKLDGARVQVHKAGDEVRVYTRSLNEVTAAVPEIIEAARDFPARALILDGEAIAIKPDGRPHSFQTTMRRFGRKLGDEAMRRELPLSVFFFDCLFADDSPLVDEPLQARRSRLEGILPKKHLTPAIVTADPVVATGFYAEVLAQGHEGIMAKALASPYEAGRRGGAWLKVKRAHTLDLVVLAAEWGSGRRKGWLSNLHLGARDPASGGWVMLGKTFKGLTDALLEWQTREFLLREVSRDQSTVHVRPELVVEIAFNDLQESPHYPGGLALRFARVKRYRPDKTAAEADSIETVRTLYEAQA